jgi:hypothetical protein
MRPSPYENPISMQKMDIMIRRVRASFGLIAVASALLYVLMIAVSCNKADTNNASTNAVNITTHREYVETTNSFSQYDSAPPPYSHASPSPIPWGATNGPSDTNQFNR